VVKEFAAAKEKAEKKINLKGEPKVTCNYCKKAQLIYLSDLLTETKDREIRKFFAGRNVEVADVHLDVDATGRYTARVTFASPQDYHRALLLNGHEIDKERSFVISILDNEVVDHFSPLTLIRPKAYVPLMVIPRKGAKTETYKDLSSLTVAHSSSDAGTKAGDDQLAQMPQEEGPVLECTCGPPTTKEESVVENLNLHEYLPQKKLFLR
ncbi:hypothetical protein Tco_0999342, partial [Tanacetum coccineum]